MLFRAGLPLCTVRRAGMRPPLPRVNMGNVNAIHSVGDSILTFLRHSYPDALRAAHPCEFALLSSSDLGDAEDLGTTLSLFLYRITMNSQQRNLVRRNGNVTGRPSLALDLHYLMIVWAKGALAEQAIMAWAMRELYLHPLLDHSLLTAEAGWEPQESVQVIPADLTSDEVMRIWDTLTPTYRLSVPYVARVVHIDADEIPEGRPVVATRFSYTEDVPPPPEVGS